MVATKKPEVGQRVIVWLSDGLWYSGYIHTAPTGTDTAMKIEWDEGGKHTLPIYQKCVFPINDDDWAWSSKGYKWEEVKDYILAGGFLKNRREEVISAVQNITSKLVLKSPIKTMPTVEISEICWAENYGVLDLMLKVTGSLDRAKFNSTKVANQLFMLFEKDVEPKLKKVLTQFGFSHKAPVGKAFESAPDMSPDVITRITVVRRYTVGPYTIMPVTQEKV